MSQLPLSTAPVASLSNIDLYPYLNSRPQGLTVPEAELRLREYGMNAISEIKGKPFYLKFLHNFTHLMALLLWVGGFIALAADLPQLAVAIWMVNLINGVFSFWQEFRAEKATEALRRLLPQYVRVLRESEEQEILAEALVPGDIILLAEGDRISADARLLQANELHVNQSTLTGESLPIRKISNPIFDPSPTPAEIRNLIFAGTNVAAGSGQAIVFATGMNTEFGKIAHLTQSMESQPSPLQREMDVVTRHVTFMAVGIGLLFFVASVLLAGVGIAESFIFALGMIVAFVPEGLLPTVTLALAMGVQRMAKRHALIKKLSSVETLGCTSVICSDKTGTLTQNEMTVRDLWCNQYSLKVTGIGYAPEGEIQWQGEPLSDLLAQDIEMLLISAALCNNARVLPPDTDHSQWRVLGDPTEAALRVVAAKAGLEVEKLLQAQPRLREVPFDSRRKRMSTIHQVCDPQTGQAIKRVYVKGAPRELLSLSHALWQNGQAITLDDVLHQEILAANDNYARDGLRVLAFAMREIGDLPDYQAATVEQDLIFLGLIAMMDPPRPEVTEAVKKCQQAGIRIIMITGDYGLTAESIARKIGIVQQPEVRIVTGAELDSLSDASLKDILVQEVIFARVAPEHKLKVVEMLQSMGHVAAVTGDGVNDAPALKKADIGVAMGITGTDVAKEAADVILTDDNFASIVNAVEEGRGVYANIRKFTTYIFTSNIAEAVPFVLFVLSATRIPLAITVMLVLAIDLGTDMLPALGLGAEPPEPGIMDHPPRRLAEHILNKPLLLRAFAWMGLGESLVSISAFYFLYWTNGYWGQWLDLPDTGQLYRAATGIAFAGVVAAQIGNVFSQRTERASILRLPWFSNRLIWVGVIVEILLVVAIVYLPIMNKVMGTAPFSPINWLFILAWTPFLIIVDEFRKWWLRYHERRAA